MEQGSSPELNKGEQENPTLSPQESSADNVDNSQPSDASDDQYLEEYQSTDNPPVEDTPSQTTQTDDDTNTDDSASVDPELEKWASSQNIKLETETERNLAKRLRDTQKFAHEKANENKQKFNQATAEADASNPQATDAARIARMEFFFNNPEAKALESKMVEIALEAHAAGDEAGFNYYRTPQGWETLYRLAKSASTEETGSQQYEAGRKDERTNLAKRQQAAAPAAQAVSSAPQSNKITDADIAKMSLQEYKKFLADNPDFDPFRF